MMINGCLSYFHVSVFVDVRCWRLNLIKYLKTIKNTIVYKPISNAKCVVIHKVGIVGQDCGANDNY